MKIGFIGLGNMGTRIVTLLLDAGHELTLWARRPASLEPFADRCTAVNSPAEVGEASELVGICVWDENDVAEVMLGDHGVLVGLPAGGVVVVHSTISPAACRSLYDEAARTGAHLIDAPVSVGANVPKLLVMVGGETETVERSRLVLESFGDPVVHLGPVGSGQIAKLINNTLLAATIGIADDAIDLGARLGLDPAALLAVLSSASARGTWSSLLAPRIIGGDSAPGGRTHEWATKDVGLTTSLAAQANVSAGRDVLRMAQRGSHVLESA